MNMFLFSLFILHAISASLCYDIQLEGIVKVGQDFLSTLNKHSEFGKKLGLPALQFASKGKLPKKAIGEAVMRAVLETNTNQTTKPPTLQDYVDHLKKKGKKSLKYVGKLIMRQINLDKNMTFLVKAAIDDYVTMVQNYHDYITKVPPEEPLIERESIYIDMVESACGMLYSEERKLLNDIIKELNATHLKNTVRIINEKIYKYSVNDKRNEIRYVCDTYKVCRRYPAFTDYCADLISEILKLPEDKFDKFIDILTLIADSNEAFFSTLVEKEDKEIIVSKLNSFSNDMNTMREFFAVLRSVITQRFKLVRGANEKLKTRTRAMRILLDIIDKSLTTEDDLLCIDFDTTVSALRNWSACLRKSVDDIFEEFAKHLFRVMEYNLTNTAKKEIRVLIEVIMRGNGKMDSYYQHMLQHGSKYVNDDEFELSIGVI